MSIDPPRLRDDPSIPGDLQDLVASATPPPPLDPLIKARSLAQLGVGSAATATGVKLWLLIGGLGAAVATGVVVTSATSSSTAVSPTTGSTSAEPSAAIGLPAQTNLETPEAESLSLGESPVFLELEESAAPMPERAEPVEPAARRSGTARSEPPADTLLLEAGILEEARLLLATNPRGTLSQTRRHAREYPRGQLRAERELIAIDALTRLRRRGAARARAAALLRRSPSGIYAERAQRMLDELAP